MITENDTGVWEIWIDDVNGELAMEKDDGAARKIEVVERSVFNEVLFERDAKQRPLGEQVLTLTIENDKLKKQIAELKNEIQDLRYEQREERP